jgi:hypothetical protein
LIEEYHMGVARLRKLVNAKLGEIRTRLFVTPTYSRAFHAYGVGMEKTGTHSIAGVLSRSFRSDHEPRFVSLIRQLVSPDGSWSPVPQPVLRRRDKRLWLEMEACWLHVFNVPNLVEAFPEARFILTVRDCYSWLDSLTSHVLARDVGPHWRRAQQAYYQPWKFSYEAGEKAFEEAGLHPLRAYLTAWSWHNHRVLDAVPADRLLVLPTAAIQESVSPVAEFLQIDARRIDAQRSHEYANPRRANMLECIDRALLADTVEELCGDLMSRWFPEAAVRT